jgi:hypothetical protein
MCQRRLNSDPLCRDSSEEDLEGWHGFLRHLKERGLAGVQLIISDACIGLRGRGGALSPGAMAALRGSLLQKRLQPGAQEQGR